MEEVEDLAFGRSCTRQVERLAASLGDLTEAVIKFEHCNDVSYGGVLFALPALLANGLLQNIGDYFELPAGYYGLSSILLILSFLALLRVKSLEGVRYLPPGELGKIVGLDRIPEVKTLREKVHVLSSKGKIIPWHRDLARYWMELSPGLSGYLYIDGHVRVYHGKMTSLPRRYVSRQRLCLRGMTDYWVNDALGQPFFVVPTALNAGLIAILKEKIIPRLLADVPNQPSQDALSKDLYLHRFVMVFDREGYSPKFFEEMFFSYRIACVTYRKYQGADWPEYEFKEKEVVFKNGKKVVMKLAERRINRSELFWMREIRKLNKNGHQTAIVTTNFKTKCEEIAAVMFMRWAQENFFKYMKENYGMDRLIEYNTQPIPDTKKVVNPEYRETEREIRKANGKLSKLKAEFSSGCLRDMGNSEDLVDYIERMTGAVEPITLEQKRIDKLKEKRKKIPKHILFKFLPEHEKFSSLATDKKMFIDTIKMIAYRAENALSNTILPYMVKKDEARSLIKQILKTEVNLKPDEGKKLLVVELHNLSNENSDRLARVLCDALNDAEITFPNTEMRIFYKLVSEKNRRIQEV